MEGSSRWRPAEGLFFFFLSLIKTNRPTWQLVNNDERLPASRPPPPPPDGRFQEQVCHVSSQLTSSRGLNGKKMSRASFDLLAVPPPERPPTPRGFTLNLPSTSRPAPPEPVAQITPQINNVPNSFGIISGSFHLLSPLGGDRRGEAASTRRPHIQLRQ